MTDVFNTPTEAVIPPVVDVVDKRLKDKDDFIEQLKREQAELREELKKRVLADDQLAELRTEITRLKEENQPREHTAPALSESSIRSLVEQTITAAEQNRTAGVNIQEANTALINHFGGDKDKAASHVNAKANELGVNVAFLKDMAAKSPSGFLKLMDATKVEKPVDPTLKRDVRTESREYTPASGLKEGTKAWFDDLRKKDPARYWQPDIQQQIFKAAQDQKYFAA